MKGIQPFIKQCAVVACFFVPVVHGALKEIEDDALSSVSGQSGITIDQNISADINSIVYRSAEPLNDGYIVAHNVSMDYALQGLTVDVTKLDGVNKDAIAIGHDLTLEVRSIGFEGLYASASETITPTTPLTEIPNNYAYTGEVIIVPSVHNCDGALIGNPCAGDNPRPNDHMKPGYLRPIQKDNDRFTVSVNKGQLSDNINMGDGSANGSISSNNLVWSGGYGNNGSLGCYEQPTWSGSCTYSPFQDINEQATLRLTVDDPGDAVVTINLDTVTRNPDAYLWVLDKYGYEIGCSGREECGNNFNDRGNRGEQLSINLADQLQKIPRTPPPTNSFLLGYGFSGNFTMTGTTYLFAD